mmetsp:Transcript_21291/g.63605  ORF Transcript_21291/g.63605 Transcript_21291/m.63605 type:complete len:225 (-) Transcript_21291:27-701(-)
MGLRQRISDRLYVQKAFGCLENGVGVSMIGCCYVAKSAGLFLCAVAIVVARALEDRIVGAYTFDEAAGGSLQYHGYSFSSPCLKSEACAHRLFDQGRRILEAVSTWGVAALAVASAVFFTFGVFAFFAASGHVGFARHTKNFTYVAAGIALLDFFDAGGLFVSVFWCYMAVVARSHWNQLDGSYPPFGGHKAKSSYEVLAGFDSRLAKDQVGCLDACLGLDIDV